MSTYGKHYPNRHHNCDCKKVLRRQAADPSISDTKFGIEATQLCENDKQSNEQPREDKKSSKRLVKKSLYRLRDAIVPQVASTHKTVRILWVLIYLTLFGFFSYRSGK